LNPNDKNSSVAFVIIFFFIKVAKLQKETIKTKKVSNVYIELT